MAHSITINEREIIMKRVAMVCAVITLTVGSVAWGQLAATRFFNLVDTPATITFSQFGEAMVQLDPQTGGVISTTGYHKVYVRVGTTSAKKIVINMGKISNTTLSQMFTRSMSQNTQAFDVIGPEMVLLLTGGKPNTTEKVQLWVYVTS
jgi:hypothetical protein